MRNVWQCEICKGLFNTKEEAYECESGHILARALSIYSVAYAKEMKWPKTITVLGGYDTDDASKATYRFVEEAGA